MQSELVQPVAYNSNVYDKASKTASEPGGLKFEGQVQQTKLGSSKSVDVLPLMELQCRARD